MLPSQRAHFDIPSDVAYLNAAGWSPLPRATQQAAQRRRRAQGPAVEARCRTSRTRSTSGPAPPPRR